MRTLFVALLLCLASSVFAGYQSLTLQPDRGTVCAGDSLTAAEVCTVDVFVPYNQPWSTISASVYLDSLANTRTDSFVVRAMYFPDRTISADMTPGDSVKTLSVRLDTLLFSHGSLPIPLAWRLTTGAVDTSINWIDSGYFTSYVENADASTVADQFSPNTGGMIRYLISQPSICRFIFCLSYLKQ